ncbi:hypothetical protein A3715_17200 [Oleiphilus sp. HI0009]|nr:hypothetical protein A3715_35070 [Oleiphilus sp. HI0009]KZX85386.1 hypothetical protein A3715_17200 [Oleiphilus sp. HI0009]
MRINLTIDEEIYPELANELKKITREKKRGAMLTKLASERLAFNKMSMATVSYSDSNEKLQSESAQSESIDGYNMDNINDLGDIGNLGL